jgi:hypothetical protein
MAKHRPEKFKINCFHSPYSNETFYMKELEYKADFTLIEQIVKSLEDIQVFFVNI